MSQPKYNAHVYNNGDWNAPPSSTKNGLCLSGGGSRALAAGLGQLIGLKSLRVGQDSTLLDSVNYISSVSGGTWLTSIFSFAVNSDLDDLLGVYTPPAKLSESNIGCLPDGSIGHVPKRLSYLDILDIVHQKIGFENIIKYPSVRKWTWPVIIGELVLKHYGLYNGIMEGCGSSLTPMPDRFFSYNPAYMEEHIQRLGGSGVANGSLTCGDFYFVQTGRPFPIMNTNIKFNRQQDDSALLPVQGTPIAVGATGTVSENGASLTADGGVESFAFSSTWESQTGDVALVEIGRRYSLIDLVASSSAFFAEYVGKEIAVAVSIYAAAMNAVSLGHTEESNLNQTADSIRDDLWYFVPQYNYWPAGTGTPNNQETGFADGGSLDNTGLLGMLARSDATNIVVCYNAETPLGSSECLAVEGYSHKVASISTDIPILFGYQPSPVNGTYVRFNDDTPPDMQYLRAAQVFESTEFGPLVSSLFAASHGQQSPTVARTRSLAVCDNSAAGISSRGNVDVLWLYNNYAEQWVDEIDRNSWLLAYNISVGRHVPGSDFYNFPNYSTGLQIDLDATQVNALAQFQAWIVNQLGDQLKDLYGVS